MSDYAINLLKAIESGEKESMDSVFNDAINAKIMDALDAKKIEVAQSIYSVNPPVEEEEIADSGEEVTADASEENGTEEV
jgi:hypothetical protein